MKQNTIQNIRPLLSSLLVTLALLIAVLTVATLLTGCVKCELETRPEAPEEGTVEIGVVWPEGADCSAARLLIYGEDGTLYREHDGLTDAYSGTLPEGTYRLILHNTDAEQVGYAALESHGTAEVYALNASGQIPSAQGELLAQPHKVYGIGRHDQGEDFTVTAGETLRLTVAPERLTREVHFYFAVSGLDAVRAVAGTLRGVVPSVLLCTREYREVAFGQPFEGDSYTPQQAQAGPGAKAPKEAIRFRATLEVFDLLTRENSPAGTNVIETTVTDGEDRSYPVQVDITGAVQQVIADNEGTLPVEIPLTLSVEVNPVTTEIHATVTPWDGGGTGGGNFE